MEQQIIALFEQRIAQLFTNSKEQLLKQESYSKTVTFENVNHYFTFLEGALTKPYNRLTSLAWFVADQDGLFRNRMYPFAFLTDEALQVVKLDYVAGAKLANALDVGGIDPDYKTLQLEDKLL